MSQRSYHRPGLVISRTSPPDPTIVRDLQFDLRRLGYLRRGVDGRFGPETGRALLALRYDLLHNRGRSTAGDGDAPVRMVDYNRGRVTAVVAEADQSLVECMLDMLRDAAFPKLPRSHDPERDNRDVAARIRSMEPRHAPPPFLAAVLRQESGGMHFRVPRGDDRDDFIVVGTDANGPARHVITSRGYGAGQHTLFHHPPRPEEVAGVMLDPIGNVEGAARLLREKLERFIRGPSSRADDRVAELGNGPLVLCRYAAADPRFMRDCVRCAASTGTRAIRPGLPLHPGSSGTWRATRYYAAADYSGVPLRERFGCDWPYAVRRYNGAGINSYHYQALVLKHLRAERPWHGGPEAARPQPAAPGLAPLAPPRAPPPPPIRPLPLP